MGGTNNCQARIAAAAETMSQVAALLEGRKGLLQVRDQVARVFEADGQAQQIGRRLRSGSFDGGAMLDEAVRAAEAGGPGEQADSGRYSHGLIAAAAYLRGEHCAESGHLPHRN